MNRFKLFIENFLVYGLGGIISKIIPLVMIPVITRIMPGTEYFGISDLSNTVVSFGSAIAIMGMYDAMYRMFFEKNEEKYKRAVCSNALIFTLFTSVVVFLVMIVFRGFIAQYFFSDRTYVYVVYLSAMAMLVGATNSIISAPTRMQNKRAIFLLTNTVSPLLSYAIAIPMLLTRHYVIALPLAAVVSGITMEIAFGIMNRKWFDPGLFDKKILKQLLIIAIPLLPNFLIYWIFNSCDKIMITNIIGVGAAGIYSVGSKLGSASQLIYTAFAGGWQYFAFATMKESDQVKSNSMVFEYLGIISFIATGFICAWSFGLFKLLFREEYLKGYVIAPYLFLAPLLQMLYQVIANQFLIIKKTWPSSLMLASGAVVNVILNYYMIPIMGIEGAAIATLSGYVVTVMVCSITLIKMGLLVIDKRFFVATIAMVLFMGSWRLLYSVNVLVGTVAASFLCALLLYLYKADIMRLTSKIKSRSAEKNNKI